jgi:hypothetical protein
MTATYGPLLPTPSWDCNRLWSSLKTSSTIYESDSAQSSTIYPDWGIASDGEWSELPTPVHLTGAQESLRLLPTPTTQHSSGGYNPAWGHGVTMADAMRSIARLNGETLDPLYDGGSASSDDPHPDHGQMELMADLG